MNETLKELLLGAIKRAETVEDLKPILNRLISAVYFDLEKVKETR